METNRPGIFHSLRFRYGLSLLVFLAAAGFFLWQEHEAHILENSVLILILGACVGMHFFMHGGHGHGHGKTVNSGGPANGDKKEAKK